MPTRCVIIGEDSQARPRKPIELVKVLAADLEMKSIDSNPSQWLNIELISRGYGWDNYDLMFAWNTVRDKGLLYVGYWNDGVAE